MSLLFAACVAAMNAGPVTPAAAVQRRNIANAEAIRVTLIDGTLTARLAQLVQVESSTAQGRTTGQVVVIDERGNRVVLPIAGSSTGGADAASEILAIAPSWWIIDEATTALPAARRPMSPLAADVRVVGAAPIPDPLVPASVFLTDGQRFAGHLGGRDGVGASEAGKDDQSIRWVHPQLGNLSLPLEHVARVVFRPADPVGAAQADSEAARLSADQPSADEDSILLVNGDRVPGYLDSLTGPPDGAAILSRGTPGTKGGGGAANPPATIPIEQIASIQLGNPPERARGLMLWLGDSSVVAAQRFDVDAANGRITLAARPLTQSGPAAPGPSSLDLADLRSVAFDAGRITPLSALPVAAFSPTGKRRTAEPPLPRPATPGWPSPLGADDIELPGPMLAEWVLPPRSVRLAGWISLEPAAAVWGDCEVSLALIANQADTGSPRELVRQRINSAHPLMPVNVTLPAFSAGARVRVTVDAGERGPIQDRVTMRRMLILTAPDLPTPGPR